MKKQSKDLFALAMIGGALFAGGISLAASHLFFFSLALLLGALGAIKILNHFAPLLPLPLHRTVSWLHSIVFELFAIAATFLARPLGYLSDKKASCGPREGRPILLVHGYLHDSSAWLFLKRQLCRRGFGPVYTLNLLPPFRSIPHFATLIEKKAEEISRLSRRTDLAIVGHSMGGLVSAWYATKVATPGHVTDVITIGSPLAGTHAAAIAIGPNGREMRRGSDFVKALREGISACGQTRFYHIASKTDQLILPYSSALTGLNPEREYVVDDIGHMTLLLSPRIANKLEEWLSSSALTSNE